MSYDPAAVQEVLSDLSNENGEESDTNQYILQRN